MLDYINKICTRENLNNLFCRTVSFSIGPHCKCLGEGQGMK